MRANILFIFTILSLFCVSVYGACTGSPPTYNGLPCATTTRYWDDQEGACGCGNSAGPFSWNGQLHTAAASQKVYDPSGSSWCGAGCGTCFEITPTGDCPTGGTCATNKSPIVIMVTNLCPYDGNEEWCPNPGSTNQFGYAQHFDLIDPNMSGWVDALGWNNPVVTYQQVACGTLGSPTCADASQCVCSMTPCSQSGSAGSSTTATSATSAKSSTSTSTSAKSSTSTSTSAKSSTSTSTSAKSSTGSTSTTAHASSTTGSSGSGTCTASVSSTVSSSWSGGGQVAITVTNTGSKSISEVVLSISGSPSVFNLVLVSGSNYNLASYAYPLAASASFTGAGFSFSGSQPSVTISSISC